MVQKLSYTANSITLGTGTSRVILGADSGNLIVKDSDANTSIVQPGLGVQGQSGVTTYANSSVLPFSPISPAGSLAYTTATGTLYMSNGSGWYKISMVNTSPSISLSSTTASPTATNLTLDFTYTVTEPEGTPTTVTFANSGIATTGNVAITHTTSNNHIRLVFDGTTKYSGDASVTLSATDGVNIGTGTITITTAYYSGKNTAENVILLKATGTGNNDNWDDKSSSNHTITDYGTIEQLAFSPYRDNGYSVYFDGSGDYLRDDTIADINDSGGRCDNFTLEMWIYNEDDPTDSDYFVGSNNLANGANDFIFGTNRTYWNASQMGSDYGATYGKRYTWQHYVIMHETDGSSNADVITLWIDGRRVFRDTGNNRISFNNNGWAFGTEADAANMGSLGNYFNGYMYDVKFTKAALYTSTNEFIPVPTEKSTPHGSANIFHGFQKPHLDFRFRNPGTIGGTAGCHPFTPFDRSDEYTTATGGGSARLRPQGGNDYFTVASSSDFAFGTGDFTVEVWVFPESMSVHQMIMDTVTPGATGGTTGRLALYLNPNKLAYYKPGGTVNQSNSATMVPFSWHHCAWVRSSGTMKMYLDGNEVYSGAETYNFSLQTLTLGKDAASGGAGQARSYWSDLRIVKGTAVYTSAFTPPTEPLTAISGTVLHLPFTDFRLFDASQTLLAKSDVSVDRLGISNAVASSGQQHFSENTIYFNGSGHHIDTPNPLSGTEDFTMEGWIYHTTSGTYDGYFTTCQVSGATGGIVVAKDKFFVTESSNPQITRSSTINNNTWYHIAIQRSGNVFAYYINGVLQGTMDPTVSLTGSVLRLASRYTDQDTTNLPFTGYMHDFRVSKDLARYPYIAEPVTLTTTNSGMTKPDNTTPTVTASNVILLTCHTGTAGSSTITDGSSNNTSITTNGNAVISDFGPTFGMKSVYFDGTGDYLSLTLASALGTGSWTIEYWVYHNSTSSNGTHINFGGDSDYTPNFYFITTFDGLKVFHTGTMSNHSYSDSHVNALDSARVVANKWYHVAYSHDDSTGKLSAFTNGSLTAEASYNGNISSTAVRIGGTTLYNHMLNGYISNLRVVKGQALYPSNFTPSTSAFQ